MKKWLFISCLIVLIIFAGFFYFKKSTSQTLPTNVLSETKEPAIAPTTALSVWKQSIVINVDEIPIRISWVEIDPEEVELYSNLNEQKLSEEIKVDKSCQILVNGGFYSKENTHLGLFVTNSETISPYQKNSLLNGFLIIKENNVLITSDLPNFNPRIAMQSGPLLIQQEKTLPLAINNDEPNRRIVAATIQNNKLMFLVFYRDSNQFEGPMLEQLPEILNLFKKQTGIDIIDAINLDGGSASVFISNYDRLDELTHIGSYFCIK